METTINNQPTSSDRAFIEGPSVAASLEEIKSSHLIPVFQDGNPVISHSEFIEAAVETIENFYPSEVILKPAIRLSHPIQGRTPEARYKPQQYCEPQDITIYYDRLMWVIEIPSISDEIDGNILSLTIGGVKAYNMDRIHSNRSADQRFKLFIGFKVKVCSNLVITTDAVKTDVRVSTLGQLQGCIKTLLNSFNAPYQMRYISRLADYSLTENQFAQVIGRCRLYQHLPPQQKSLISPLLINDSQIGTVVKEYYKGPFRREEDGSINLWKLHNLFTESTKSSYLDTFIEKNSNAFQIVQELRSALENKSSSWFLT